jgi:hypothetical protein
VGFVVDTVALRQVFRVGFVVDTVALRQVFRVGFVVDTVALRQVFPPINTIPPICRLSPTLHALCHKKLSCPAGVDTRFPAHAASGPSHLFAVLRGVRSVTPC